MTEKFISFLCMKVRPHWCVVGVWMFCVEELVHYLSCKKRRGGEDHFFCDFFHLIYPKKKRYIFSFQLVIN